MALFFYNLSGLAVQSEIPLPGLIPLDDDRTPDVTIGAATVPDMLADALATGPTWQRSERQFLLDIPSVGRFLLEDGRHIAYQRAPDVEDPDIAIFLAGNVFGTLLHQRNHIVLHASAIAVNGKAVLFCGASGAGKSTMAAALGERGYALVADDQCAITVGADGVPVVHPDGRYLKLWAHAIDALALVERKGDAMRARIEKFYVAPGVSSVGAMPVGAVYALIDARPPREEGIERPNIVDVTRLIVANAYRPALVSRMGQRQAYFTTGAALANVAGVFTLSRTMGFKNMPSTIERLERHWVDSRLATEADLPGRAG